MANKNAKPKNPRVSAIVSLVAILVVVAVCGYVALFGIGKIHDEICGCNAENGKYQ